MQFKMKLNFKMNKLAGAKTRVVVPVMLLISYVFLFLGEIVLALVLLPIATIISLNALLGVGRRHTKDHLI
jgi:hypothetical protein